MTENQKLEIITEVAKGCLGRARELCEKYENTETKLISSTIRENVIASVQEQFNNFKNTIISNWTKEMIFQHAFEISTKSQIVDAIIDIEFTSEQYAVLDKVDKETNNTLLGQLYGYYLDCENAKMDTREDVEQWIEWFCEERGLA